MLPVGMWVASACCNAGVTGAPRCPQKCPRRRSLLQVCGRRCCRLETNPVDNVRTICVARETCPAFCDHRPHPSARYHLQNRSIPLTTDKQYHRQGRLTKRYPAQISCRRNVAGFDIRLTVIVENSRFLWSYKGTGGGLRPENYVQSVEALQAEQWRI